MCFDLLQDERTFSEEEEEKLQTTLGMDGADIELLIQTLEFFLQQVNTFNCSENLELCKRFYFSNILKV